MFQLTSRSTNARAERGLSRDYLSRIGPARLAPPRAAPGGSDSKFLSLCVAEAKVAHTICVRAAVAIPEARTAPRLSED